MYLGRVVECGTTEEVLESPQHPYTQALLSVVPEIERLEPVVLTGEIPDPTRIPGGCRFHPRCPALADGGAAAAGVAEAAGPRRSPCSPRPATTGPPATWRCSARTRATRPELLTRESVRRPAMPTCRRHCPRRCTSTRTPGARTRGRAVRRVVLRGPPGRPRPGRALAAVASTWPASRCWSPVTAGRAARGVQRLPAPRQPAPARSAGEPAATVPGVGAALPLPLVDLRPRRPAAEGTARRPRRPGGLLGSTRSAWTPGAASCSCT